MLNLLQINLFEKWCIHDLVHGRSAEKMHANSDQLFMQLRVRVNYCDACFFKVFDVSCYHL